MYKNSVEDFMNVVNDRDLKSLLIFSIEQKLIDGFHPSNVITIESVRQD